MSQAAALVSTQNHVEAPFIIIRIGEYTFGHCEKSYKSKLQTHFKITYPNYMESLNVTKINGAINTYVLNMKYAITQYDDPNMLEKVFSSISKSRTIYLSYGDWNAPSFIYKEEEAIITKLTTRVNLQSSSIDYVINCTSSALSLTAGTFQFPARYAKPSDVMIGLLNNKGYGLQDIFTGMRNLTTTGFANFIDGSDKSVQLEAKNCNVIEYISYLVSCMVYVGDSSPTLKSACYYWSVYDDVSNEYGGTYFKVVKVTANTPSQVSFNTYEVDVGYPTADCVTSFTINNDDSWALLYDYTKDIQLPEYSYSIDDKGDIVQTSSSVLALSKTTFAMNESVRNWWSMMTQFPITATLTMKGLLRPAMLMSYVKVNTYFYGHKHTSSGLYIITKQEDTISSSGYRTQLSLTRVGGDESYA